MPLSESCSIYANNTFYRMPRDFTASTTTSGGNAVFYLTDDGTATGNAVFDTVFLTTCEVSVPDHTGIYQSGAPSLSADKKTLTVPVTKQTFTGVVVLGINVLGSVAMTPVTNGTTAYLFIEGV